MKHIIHILFAVFCLFFVACSDSDTDYYREPTEKEPEDPLRYVKFTIRDGKIYEGVHELGDTIAVPVYTIDGDYIRQGADSLGQIVYTRDGDLFYKNDKVKGLPYMGFMTSWTDKIFLVTHPDLNKLYRWEDPYLHTATGYFNKDLSYYLGEIAFNIDGKYIRQGREASGEIMFNIVGNEIRTGANPSASVFANIDGDYIRRGASPVGEILFTRDGNYFYKGSTVLGEVMFNLDRKYIRKGSKTMQYGERRNA